MKSKQIIGIGEPELMGKKTLFQPGKGEPLETHREQGIDKSNDLPVPRVRTTIGLTNKAMATIQDIQNRYRLHTGKVLPLWKLVSDAIEYYGKSNKNQDSTNPLNRGPTIKTTSGASLAQT